MIQKITLGTKHEDVIEVQFGVGDIMFTKLIMGDGSNAIAFAQSIPHKIGETSDEYEGKKIDDFKEEIKVLFTFTKPESIAALILSLVELQQQFWDTEGPQIKI